MTGLSSKVRLRDTYADVDDIVRNVVIRFDEDNDTVTPNSDWLVDEGSGGWFLLCPRGKLSARLYCAGGNSDPGRGRVGWQGIPP